ncbi:MAG: hypothetical protein KJ658_07695, partial [Proteobacteria bacterium]|nr:hypothetical protein [Pseudomonadota bacterium]
MAHKRHRNHTKRLMAVFVASFVLVLGVCFFSIESGRRFTQALDSGEKHFRSIASAATQVSSFAKRAEGHLMLHLSFHGEIDRKKISERLTSLQEQIAILDRLVKAPRARQVVEKIKFLEKKILLVLPPLLAAHDKEIQATGGFMISNHKQAVLDAHEFFSQTRQLGVELAEIEFGLEQEFKTRLSLAVKKMRISFYLILMGILIFLILLGIFLIRINHRLNREILYREQAQLALEESEKNLQILSGQTEQLSLAAAETISMKDKKLVFQRISNAIVDHTDYQRVIISLFKETFPYRDIVGYAGMEEDKIAHLRSVAFPKSWYDGVFEQGIQVGQFSYYVPHKMKHILNQDAVVYGQGPEPTEENTWHPQDNLFVRMNDENGQFIGVISVDDAKSGKAPCDKTLRPLEIFSSLISQIIILKREQEEKKKIEARLQQAIKMESIGTLTGGIAHDFNNILGIVLGNTELALGDMRQDHPARTRLEEIKHSCLKAA